MYLSDTILISVVAMPIALLCVKEYSRLKYESDLFVRFIQVEAQVKELKGDIKYLKEELENEKLQRYMCTDNSNASTTKETVKGRTDVFFDAALSKHVELEPNETLVFDDVWVNSGLAYDKENGKFVVPVHGLYLFSLTAVAQANSFARLLVKQGKTKVLGGVKACSEHTNVTESASATVIRKLHKGDVITVTGGSKQSARVHGNSWTYFTGTLM